MMMIINDYYRNNAITANILRANILQTRQIIKLLCHFMHIMYVQRRVM